MRTIVVALAVALVTAGSSTAAFVVTSKNIKNGTIQTVDISAKAKRALKGNRGLRGLQGAPGTAGATGPPGPQGPPGVQALFHVVNTVSVAPSTSGNVTAECPAGQRAVSGGFGFGGIINASYRTATGWAAAGYNDLPGPMDLTAFAYCSANITASSSTASMSRQDVDRLADAR